MPYFTGWSNVVRAPIKCASALIGNVPGVRDPNDPETLKLSSPPALVSSPPAPVPTPPAEVASPPSHAATPAAKVQAVGPRTAKVKRPHPLILPNLLPLTVTPKEFAKLQDSCATLKRVREKVTSGEEDQVRDGSVYKFVSINGVLHRSCVSSKRPAKVGRFLLVPAVCRSNILCSSQELSL